MAPLHCASPSARDYRRQARDVNSFPCALSKESTTTERQRRRRVPGPLQIRVSECERTCKFSDNSRRWICVFLKDAFSSRARTRERVHIFPSIVSYQIIFSKYYDKSDVALMERLFDRQPIILLSVFFFYSQQVADFMFNNESWGRRDSRVCRNPSVT